jgi:hypothetical protein
MNVARQPNHAPGLSVLLVMALWAGSASFAHAAGYWTCSGGSWIAVGHPEYAMPIKSCGFRLEIPRTQLACEQAGGSWGRRVRGLGCKMPTHDGGRTCADVGECEGLCLAALTPPQRDLVIKRQKLQLLGNCTPSAPMLGCMAIVKEGFVTAIRCQD